MMVTDNPCEDDYLFCGMRILNCEPEPQEIESYVWEHEYCGSRQWNDQAIPSGMSPIGVDLFADNRDIWRNRSPIGIGILLREPPN